VSLRDKLDSLREAAKARIPPGAHGGVGLVLTERWIGFHRFV
jgi:hypothetical protein